LVRDVFPNIEFKDIEYETLAEAIRNVCKETNLVINEMQVTRGNFYNSPTSAKDHILTKITCP
jgi:flagellar motor switch protein FliM